MAWILAYILVPLLLKGESFPLVVIEGTKPVGKFLKQSRWFCYEVATISDSMRSVALRVGAAAKRAVRECFRSHMKKLKIKNESEM